MVYDRDPSFFFFCPPSLHHLPCDQASGSTCLFFLDSESISFPQGVSGLSSKETLSSALLCNWQFIISRLEVELLKLNVIMPSIFPLEIEEMILDILGEDDEGHSALKTCSLVCQAFLPICRKHIFGNIVLNASDQDVVPPPSTYTTRGFERLLRETPEIADYIRKLGYTIRADDLTSPLIQESLKLISRLEFLSVQHHHWLIGTTLSWNNPIRPALLHLLHLPTLTHFKMTRITDFVISDLIPCVNLKYLDIGGLTTGAFETTFPAALPVHSIQPNEFVAGIGTFTAIKRLCTARRPDRQLIMDFGSLSKITVSFQMPNDDEVSRELFRHCHVLTNVNVSCKCYLHYNH